MSSRLERMRRQKGWSQAELARRACLNQVTVNQIERGRLRPYPSQLEKLALALGIPSECDTLMEEVVDE